MAEALGVEQQICRAHVNRNVADLIATLGTQALEHPHPVPPELQARGVTVEQFLEDLVRWRASFVAYRLTGNAS